MNENLSAKQTIDKTTKKLAEDNFDELKEEDLIGKGWYPEVGTSMGFLNWLTVMNNVSEIFSNPEFIKSIEEGKYNLLIVDDASARVPALIFRKIINNIYRKKNISEIKTLFVPGQLRSADPNISEKISNHINSYLEKVNFPKIDINTLVITDTISEGRTLKILSDALVKSSINYDIAAVSLEIPSSISNEKRDKLEDLLGSKIYTATNFETSDSSLSTSRSYSHGVKKNTGDMVSEKIIGVQDHINQARKMVDKISEGIIEQINSTEPIISGPERFNESFKFIKKYWSISD